jgi:hypothetical protein
MDVTEVGKKSWPRNEKTDEGREIGTASQASQSLRFTRRKTGNWKRYVWLLGDTETRELITEVTVTGKIRIMKHSSRVTSDRANATFTSLAGSRARRTLLSNTVPWKKKTGNLQLSLSYTKQHG